MKLIIDIPDDLYNTINSLPDYMCGVYQNVIKEGIPFDQLENKNNLMAWVIEPDTSSTAIKYACSDCGAITTVKYSKCFKCGKKAINPIGIL